MSTFELDLLLALRAENALLRKALQEIMVVRLSHLRSSEMQAAMHSMRDIARAALDKEVT